MSRKLTHVAAAAIRNSKGDYLIAKRSANQHQGGLWEFPGGKVEAGEEPLCALNRELEEELGIQVVTARPLIKVPYHYEDKSVLLDVFEVSEFEGEPWGREGQPVQWVMESDLDSFAFPAANRPIVDACLLPCSIAITPSFSDVADLERFSRQAISAGAEAIMLRAHDFSERDFIGAYQILNRLCEEEGVVLIANTSLELAEQHNIDALHLTSSRLESLENRERFSGRWLSASCHNKDELALATLKGVDFISLSPVLETVSHPDAEPLGWECFRKIANECPMPVYALGGLSVEDLATAQRCGAQGMMSIRAWGA